MLLSLSGDPKSALIKGAKAVGTLFVAVVLALYGHPVQHRHRGQGLILMSFLGNTNRATRSRAG
ncbi:hypothetical protein SPARM206S_00434 [Streptomyces parvulus]